MSERDMVIVSRSDPEGLVMSNWASPILSEALCDLASVVMPGDQASTKFRGIAIRSRGDVGGVVQISTGLLVERFSEKDTPDGLLRLSGRALLLFTAREGFGVALAETVVAESYGEIASMRVKRAEDQIALGMVSMSAFSANEMPYFAEG